MLGDGNSVPFLGQDHDRSTLRGLVREARRQRGHREFGLGRAVNGEQLGRLAGAEGDGAGLVQQQCAHVAGGLDRATTHCQHVALHQPIHPGDPDGRQQAADRRRDETHEQRDQHDDGLLRVGVHRERLEGDDRQQEDHREPCEQDVQRDLVRRLLSIGALDEQDHAVEERLAGAGRDPHDDPVGEHSGTARDG